MPIQHGQEHLVAAFGAHHQHRGHDRHHDAEETLASHTLADIIERQRRVRAQPVVVGLQ
ncbi:MAG: hypothetical protein ACKVP6_10330 [Mycobacterium sp.]